jgi:hypothetical protein
MRPPSPRTSQGDLATGPSCRSSGNRRRSGLAVRRPRDPRAGRSGTRTGPADVVGRRERTRTGRDPVAVRLRAGSAREPSTLRDLAIPLDRSAARDPNRRRGNLRTAEQGEEQHEDVGRDEQAAASGSHLRAEPRSRQVRLPRLAAAETDQRARRRRTRVVHLGRLTRAAGIDAADRIRGSVLLGRHTGAGAELCRFRRAADRSSSPAGPRGFRASRSPSGRVPWWSGRRGERSCLSDGVGQEAEDVRP